MKKEKSIQLQLVTQIWIINHNDESDTLWCLLFYEHASLGYVNLCNNKVHLLFEAPSSIWMYVQ